MCHRFLFAVFALWLLEACSEDPPAPISPAIDDPSSSAFQDPDAGPDSGFDSGQEVDPEISLEDLEALGYTHRAPVKESQKLGVSIWDERLAQPGYNLYADYQNKAYLLDMAGKEVHRWKFDKGVCSHVRMLEDGSVLAVFNGSRLAKFDWDSNLTWEVKISAHHDVCVMLDMSIWVPYHEPPRKYQDRMVIFDAIAHLSPTGERLGHWSTYENHEDLLKYHEGLALDKRDGDSHSASFDYYHQNSVAFLPRNRLSKDPRFRPGNLLVSLRNVSLVVILDQDTHEVVWVCKQRLDWQHHATMLPTGNILIFDNGARREWSRVLEVSPENQRIAWEYRGTPPPTFYSKFRGGCQRLKNGNTLICETEPGLVFEVTREKQVVWAFRNPHQTGGLAGLIYRLTRIPEWRVKPLLRRAERAEEADRDNR